MTAVLDRYMQEVLKPAWELLESNLAPTAAMRLYAEGLMVREDAPPGCLMAEMMINGDQLGPGTHALLREHMKEHVRRFEKWVQRWQEQGMVIDEVPPPIAARHIASLLVSLALQAHRGGRPERLRQHLSLSLRCYFEEPLYPY